MESRAFLQGYAALVFFVVLAGDAVRYPFTWFGYGAAVVALAVVAGILLVKQRDRWRLNGLPYPLLVFLVLAALSTAWSFYPVWTATAAITSIMTAGAGVALAITLTREEFLRCLGIALKAIVGLSMLFELFVSLVIRHPILPWWTDYRGQKIHAAYYWSRDVLFKGDRIQGIVGNSNLLGFMALLAILVVAVQLGSGSVRRSVGIFWIALAVAELLLTRSSTVLVACAVVAVVAAVLLAVRRTDTARQRWIVYVTAIALIALGVTAMVVFRGELLHLLGKSNDLTGRGRIWEHVVDLAGQRSVFGWGWVSYWVPFIEPFTHLAINGGVRLLQAHEAWLDVWFQLGAVGFVVFAALVGSTAVRAWMIAVDRPQFRAGVTARYSALSLLPALLLAALIAQSFAESRLLVEYGFLLLAAIATSTKRDQLEPRPS